MDSRCFSGVSAVSRGIGEMSSFDKKLFQNKLQELTRNSYSIQTLSVWVMHHRKDAMAIVNCWAEEVCSSKSSERLINLLYLANDICQTAKKKGQYFLPEFASVLPKLFDRMFRYKQYDNTQAEVNDVRRLIDSNVIRCYKRVLDIWKERDVFPFELINELNDALVKFSLCTQTIESTEENLHYNSTQKLKSSSDLESVSLKEIEQSLKFLVSAPSQDGKTREAICNLGIKFQDPNLIIQPLLNAISELESSKMATNNQDTLNLNEDILEKIQALEKAYTLLEVYRFQLQKELTKRDEIDHFLTILQTETSSQSVLGNKVNSKIQHGLRHLGDLDKLLTESMKNLPLFPILLLLKRE